MWAVRLDVNWSSLDCSASCVQRIPVGKMRHIVNTESSTHVLLACSGLCYVWLKLSDLLLRLEGAGSRRTLSLDPE